MLHKDSSPVGPLARMLIMKNIYLFFWILLKYNLPVATTDHAFQLFISVHPDFKIASKYKCGLSKYESGRSKYKCSRRKTSNIVAGVIEKN